MDWKKIAIPVTLLLVVLVGGFFTFRFFSKGDTSNGDTTITSKEENLKIEDVVEKIRDSGFLVTEETQNFYTMVGANDGLNLDVDGISLEIYEYTQNQKEMQNATLEQFSASETTSSSTSSTLEVENLLIVIHSTDSNFLTSIENVLVN